MGALCGKEGGPEPQQQGKEGTQAARKDTAVILTTNAVPAKAPRGPDDAQRVASLALLVPQLGKASAVQPVLLILHLA